MTSTDLAVIRPTSLELAPTAWKLAEKIAGTDFVPTALRGKPEAVLACILAGHEAGISPMQALSKIHIIEGRPAMAAELMRALILAHGHEFEFEEMTTTSVTAAGRRKGSERWTRVTWTLDDAKKGGLAEKPTWRKWPRAMLTARATSELARLIFADVLAGISHTIEELTDGDVADGLVDFGPPETVPPDPPAKKTGRAARTAARQTRHDSPETTPDAPQGELPPLPDDGIIDAELVEETPPQPPSVEDSTVAPPETAPSEEQGNAPEPTDNPAPSAPEANPDDWPSGEWESGDWPSDPEILAKRYTGPQIVAIKLYERFGIRGSSDEARKARLDAIAALLRPVESSKELTPDEIQTVIRRIDEWPEGQPLDPQAFPPEPAEAPTTDSPDTYTGERWRELLAARKVKVTETMHEAQRLAAALDPPVTVATLDDIAGRGIGADLLGWIEDLSLERRSK